MKKTWILAALLPLTLTACGEQAAEPPGEAPTAAPAVTEDAAGDTTAPADVETSSDKLKREADEWVKETKDLGSAAWEATKETSAEYSEKAGDYYEDAKAKSKEYYDQAKQDGAELYEQAKQEGSELYEKAKEKGHEVYEGAKADMEARDGHPPAMEPAR